MPAIWWDNGGGDFGLLDRRLNPVSWRWPAIAQALVRGASNAVVIANEPSQTKPATPDGPPARE